MTIIWCIVPEIWSMTDRIFWHFGPFFALNYLHNNPKNQNLEKMKERPRDIIILQISTINNNHMMYGSWDIKHNRLKFLSFWTIFSLLSPNNPKNQNFEKMKKTSGGILILHKRTINDNHMMYGSWDIKHDRQNFLLFWTIFYPPPPPNSPKNQS